jgi:hypothetical protein
MSKWYEPKIEDISLSSDGKELHALIDDDNQGNIWVSINIEDILKIINQNHD